MSERIEQLANLFRNAAAAAVAADPGEGLENARLDRQEEAR